MPDLVVAGTIYVNGFSSHEAKVSCQEMETGSIDAVLAQTAPLPHFRFFENLSWKRKGSKGGKNKNPRVFFWCESALVLVLVRMVFGTFFSIAPRATKSLETRVFIFGCEASVFVWNGIGFLKEVLTHTKDCFTSLYFIFFGSPWN